MIQQTLLMLTIASVSVFQLANAHHENPTVATPMGSIKGSMLTTVLGKPIYAFRGIRYANAERFQPPVPVRNWNNVYDATEDGAMCPQPVLRPVSEDCLFLNVYSTKLPKGKNNPKRPVYIHLHPGGFYAISGSSVWAGPDYFMDQDIVLVTLNYRLGSLGFLSTGDHLAPGNNGLKDQVVALKWVQENIAAFGGDPDLVTISGYSAGAISVTLHLLSPMSKGLFHRAIIMSSTALSNWEVPTHQFDLAQKQANLVGCPNDTSANIIECLKAKPAEQLGDSLFGFFIFGNNPILIWKPVIEPDFGQERFILEDPTKTVQCGKFAKVPVMVGATALEFAQQAYRLVRNATLLRQLNEDFNTLAPIALYYESNPERINISKHLRKFYLGDGPLTNSSVNGLGELFADRQGFGLNRVAKLLAAKNTENVYYYLFSYYGRYSHFYLPGTETPWGAVHHDDLMYLVHRSPLFPRFNVSFPEYAMVQTLTKLHANFALIGNPTPGSTAELDNVHWQPFTNQNNKYMDIGNKLVMKENLYTDRYDEWDKLFPLPGCHQ